MTEGLGESESSDRAILWKVCSNPTLRLSFNVKVFLGYFSTPPNLEKWYEEAQQSRQRYEDLRDRHLILSLGNLYF